LVTLLKVPQAAGPPLHPAMLQVTPLLLGSFVTVAVKSWLPLVRRLAVGGTTATETAEPRGDVGPGESLLQAARRSRAKPVRHRVSV